MEIATVATRIQIARAIAVDAVAWIVPFVIAAALVAFVPFVMLSLSFTIIVWGLAFIATFIAFARDAKSLARYGYTEGLRRRGLRVIDPIADITLYKARLFRKSVWGILIGRYKVINLGVVL